MYTEESGYQIVLVDNRLNGRGVGLGGGSGAEVKQGGNGSGAD